VAIALCVLPLAVTACRVGAFQGSPPERFDVVADGHPLVVWARRPANPRHAILLVHGRTWSSRPDFDLQVPGLDRSALSSLSGRGVASYAVDLRGYGETKPDPSGWLTPRRSAADVTIVLDWIRQQHPSLPPPALAGWSRGGAIAMLAAQLAPGSVSSLIVFGFAFDPDTRFVDAPMPSRPPIVRNTIADAKSDFVSPAVTPAAVVRAFTEQALRADPRMVNLARDSELNDIQPARITMPFLLIYGDRDPSVAREDAARLFARIGSRDKTLTTLPGADHAAHLEDVHSAWIDAVVGRIAP
jgi:alpha-beta hydrolase superfamily lysophospholipase